MRPSFKVLIIEPSKESQRSFSGILKTNNYSIKIVNGAEEGIQVALSGNFNLIIAQKKLQKYSGFQVYKLLESYIAESCSSFFIVSDKFDNEDFLIGLEMGIDNFILTPINEKSLLKKIENIRKKLHKTNISELSKFKDFFQNSPVAMFVFDNRLIVETNKAFSKLFNMNEIKGTPLKFDSIFKIDGEAKNKMSFLKFENCLADYCVLEKVKFVGDEKRYFTMFNHNVGNQRDKKFLGQVVVAHEFSSESVHDDSCPLYGTCLKIANKNKSNKIDPINLTEREHEVYLLSAKGLPIKHIAANLNLSERTVEKHRSNIMVKTGSQNIIESILAIQKNRVLNH